MEYASDASPKMPGMDRRGDQAFAGVYFRFGKRAFDIIGSLMGLILTSPILLVCALLVRLTSKGPAFFRHNRLGRGDLPFKVFKFRTLYEGSERLGTSVALSSDARVTPVGRFLRRTKLDELPQLINVFNGDMSLVGPRPLPLDLIGFSGNIPDSYRLLLPGITSYASIYHRMEAEFCERQTDPHAAHRGSILRQKRYLDEEYLKNLSFPLDLKLIFLTFLLVFVPGKAQPRTVQFFGMGISAYSRVVQMLIEIVVWAAAVWLAYWLRFEDQMPEFYRLQRDAFILILPGARLLVNYTAGIYNMIWRYVNLVDAAVLAISLSVVSVLLLILRLVLSSQASLAHVFQLPLSVIVMEYFFVLGALLGLRGLRRALYEMDHRYQPLPTDKKRRILIMGAGLSGTGIATEIGLYSHLHLIGFVDDDHDKTGRVIAGRSVLGTSEILSDLIKRHEVTDLIVCVRSLSPEILEKIKEQCQPFAVGVHVIPTIDQLLGLNVTGAEPVAQTS